MDFFGFGAFHCHFEVEAVDCLCAEIAYGNFSRQRIVGDYEILRSLCRNKRTVAGRVCASLHESFETECADM